MMSFYRRVSFFGFIRVSAMLVCLVGVPELVYAQNCRDSDRPFVSIYFENDIFFGTDQSYTDGVKLLRARCLEKGDDEEKPELQPPRWVPAEFFRRKFGPSCFEDPDTCWRWWGGWTIGQNMYTPQDIRDSTIIEDDRPYGGWLYIGKVLYIFRPDQLDQKATLHAFELDVGVTGVPSLAKQAQTFIHAHISPKSPNPEGWEHQIRFEPTVQLQYTGRQRTLDGKKKSGQRFFDLLPEWNLLLGNVFTYAGAGGTARLGHNLGDDFGSPRNVAVAPGMGERSKWEYYLFGGFTVRVVAHNIFLTGGIRRDSPHTVGKEYLVGDVEVGGFLRYKRYAVTFRWVRRSPEFNKRIIFQEYGAINVTLLL